MKPAGGGMQMNSMGGVGIFSRENMAMMIVDRERATKGMSADQAAAARKEEMAKHGSETPAENQARKATYDSEWLKLTAAEKSDALTKLDTQMKARGMMAPAK
jgi:TfoX/Sxy family transcriptional regulator of competence genes